MTTTTTKKGPIEVWLTQPNLEVSCMIVHEDESTDVGFDVTSMTMRGAQREMTGWFISQGYTPVGRWESARSKLEDIRDDGSETFRRFKPSA